MDTAASLATLSHVEEQLKELYDRLDDGEHDNALTDVSDALACVWRAKFALGEEGRSGVAD